MTHDVRRVERLRATPLLVASVAAQVTGLALFLANVTEQRVPPFVCWLPALIGTLLAAIGCWRTATEPALGRVSTRLWRQLTVVVLLVAAGLVGDARQAFAEPAGFDGLEPNSWSDVFYALAMVVLLWALLRLPIGNGNEKERVARFVLDALTVGITMGIVGWYR